jgi:hypothetical protein
MRKGQDRELAHARRGRNLSGAARLCRAIHAAHQHPAGAEGHRRRPRHRADRRADTLVKGVSLKPADLVARAEGNGAVDGTSYNNVPPTALRRKPKG